MFQVVSLTAEDFTFATALTDTMNWGLVDEDLKFHLALEPDGCFILLEESMKIGLAMTISYGKIGWIGNVVVSDEKRGRGAGSQLVKHAIQYLEDQKVETIGIYAYLNRISFYERLKFVYDSDFLVLKGKGIRAHASDAENTHIVLAHKSDLIKIIEVDIHCFGASREKLFTPLLIDPDNLCYLAIQDNEIMGFVIGKVYDGIADIGPLVCKQECDDTALRLLTTIITRLEGYILSLCIPQSETFLLEALKVLGFKEAFRVARMLYGRRLVNKCIYIAESLERG